MAELWRQRQMERSIRTHLAMQHPSWQRVLPARRGAPPGAQAALFTGQRARVLPVVPSDPLVPAARTERDVHAREVTRMLTER